MRKKVRCSWYSSDGLRSLFECRRSLPAHSRADFLVQFRASWSRVEPPFCGPRDNNPPITRQHKNRSTVCVENRSFDKYSSRFLNLNAFKAKPFFFFYFCEKIKIKKKQISLEKFNLDILHDKLSETCAICTQELILTLDIFKSRHF